MSTKFDNIISKFQEVFYENDNINQNNYPRGRSGHSMIADDGNIYMFGGYNPKGNTFNNRETACVLVELWKYNFATSKWKNLTSPGVPDTCASSCMLRQGRRLFVYGGTGYPFGEMMSNSVKVCEFNNERQCYWYLLETNPNVYNCLDSGDNTPPRGYGQSLVLHEGCLYTFGGAMGFHDEAVNDLHRLNSRTLTWEKLFPTGVKPSGRYKQETAIYKERFFVFGGGRLHYTEELNNIFAYDPSQNRWEEIKTYPDPLNGHPNPRCSFGLAQIEDCVYICGGRFYDSEVAHAGLTDMWRISLLTFQWQRIPVELPEPLYFHRVVISPSFYLYVYGGVTEEGERSSRMFRWRVPYNIPKLAELSWDVVTRSIKRLDAIPKDILEPQFGIPRRFLDRVS